MRSGEAGPLASSPASWRRAAGVALALAATVAADQAAKLLARSRLAGSPPVWRLGGAVRFEYAENRGAFLSLGESLPQSVRFALFVLLVGAALAAALLFALRARSLPTAELAALALMAGGGIGNLDRPRGARRRRGRLREPRLGAAAHRHLQPRRRRHHRRRPPLPLGEPAPRRRSPGLVAGLSRGAAVYRSTVSATVKHLYEQALDLEEEERAELAGRLLASLDGEDEGVDDAWRQEVARRMAEIDSGAVQAVSWEEAREQLFGQHIARNAAEKL